jgi:hypothetical protein
LEISAGDVLDIQVAIVPGRLGISAVAGDEVVAQDVITSHVCSRRLMACQMALRHPVAAMLELGADDKHRRKTQHGLSTSLPSASATVILPEFLRLRVATERLFARRDDAKATLQESLRAADEVGIVPWKRRSAYDLAILLKDEGS